MKCLELYLKECSIRKKSKNTIENINQAVKSLINYFNSIGVSPTEERIKTITIEETFGYRDYLIAKGYKNGTINNRINSLKGFYSFMSKYGIIKDNPFKGFSNLIEDDKTVKDVLTKEEVLKVIKAFDTKLTGERSFEYKSKRNKAIISILASTGIRVNNLLSVTIDRLIPIEGGYKIEFKAIETKGRVPVTIYIVGKNKELMEDWLKVRKDKTGLNLLFNTVNGKKISISDINSIVEARVNMCNISKHITIHSLRAFTANNMLANGVNINDVKKLLGWKIDSSEVMYNTYYRDDMQEKKYIEYSQLLYA